MPLPNLERTLAGQDHVRITRPDHRGRIDRNLQHPVAPIEPMPDGALIVSAAEIPAVRSQPRSSGNYAV
jgi:hypothetical protein